jgi:hypothetical protein
MTYPVPLPIVMSRENSAEDVRASTAGLDIVGHVSRSFGDQPEAGPSRYFQPSTLPSSRKSKGPSSPRPILTLEMRGNSYSPSSGHAPPQTAPQMYTDAADSPAPRRQGLKRRISTPSLVKRNVETLEPSAAEEMVEQGKGKSKAESRARSTSTSLVVPDSLSGSPATYPVSPQQVRLPPTRLQFTSPPTPGNWDGIYITPASPEYEEERQISVSAEPPSLLTSAYNMGESAVLGLVKLVRSHRHEGDARRRASEDSEKGLDGDEGVSDELESRESVESLRVREGGRYWGLWGSDDVDRNSGYFSLPPTPPDEKPEPNLAGFEAALQASQFRSDITSLPTPALSASSLSRGDSRSKKLRKAKRFFVNDGGRQGLLASIGQAWIGCGTGKTGEVIKGLGWTVGFLAGLFVVSLGLAFLLLRGLPM